MKNKAIFRVLAMILAVIMTFGGVPFVNASEQASELENSQTNSQPMVISVSSDNHVRGAEVDVLISLENNPGIASMKIAVAYDSGIILESVTYNKEMKGEGMQPQTLASPVILNWYRVSGQYEGDCTYATLRFRISDDAQVNTVAGIRVTFNPNDIYDENENNIECTVSNGSISIIDNIPGDINHDGVCNNKDLTRMVRYFAKWDVSANIDAMDTNNDEKVNNRDLIAFLQYLSGWDTVIWYGDIAAVYCRHSMNYVPANNATCEDNGNIEYWCCTQCNKCFSDENGSTEIAYVSTVILATGHSLVRIDDRDSNCTEPGNIEYWICTGCYKYYSDSFAITEITHDQTVLEAKGHSLDHVSAKEPTYSEPGNIEYWICSNCESIFKDEACKDEININDTVIAPREKYEIEYDLYSDVQYLNSNKSAVTNPNPSYYDKDEGLVLADAEASGYTFMGWYDEQGKKVSKIEKGKSGVVYLKAKWEVNYYTLTMRDVNNDSKTIEFTVEQSFELETPVWKGLLFSHWEDKSGKLEIYYDSVNKLRAKLNKGTTEDIEVVAKWKNLENLVYIKGENSLSAHNFNEESGLYWFVYELGKIENVVLDSTRENITHSGVERNYTISQTVEVSETKAEQISKKVAEYVKESNSLSEMDEKMYSLSASVGQSVTVGTSAEVSGEIGVAKAKAAASLEVETSLTVSGSASRGEQTTKFKGSEESEEESNTYESSLCYAKKISTTETNSYTLKADDPTGTYQLVHVGEVKVFAFVIYNPINNMISFEVISTLDNMSVMFLYQRSGYVDYANDSLNYDISYDEIAGVISSSYGISYDANGGEGSMPSSMHKVGAKYELSYGAFTKTGYTQTGWELRDEKGNVVRVIVKGEKMLDLTDAGKSVKLYAHWTPNKYTIKYETKNGYLSGSYTTEYTVESEKIEIPTPQYKSYPEYNHFICWYEDEAKTVKFKADLKTRPRNVTLYADWDLCTTYNTIDSTPYKTPEGRVIIDWSNES